MTHDEFLTNASFPKAPENCRSLARWNSSPGWIAGQLAHKDPNELILVSAQARPLTVRCRSTIPFCVGDHIAVRIEQEEDRWIAEEAVLLVRATEPAFPRTDSGWRPFLHGIHDFFRTRNFVEIETPSLVDCPGMEPALEPFQAQFNVGSRKVTRYLPTSPEIHLKKALCLGWTDIYEIKPCFRNGEFSEMHQPEFTMLEWYRAYSDLKQVAIDLSDLVEHAGGTRPVVTAFAELFQEKLGLHLQPSTSIEELRAWCLRLKIESAPSDSHTDLFHRIWLEKIEPELTGTLIVRDFPPLQAAMARVKADGWADRFELYWDGVEIANAFHEVNDPEEQIRRWQLEVDERRRLGRTPLAGDQELLDLMKRHGMPPTGGIAVGLERLFMMARGIRDIRELRPFPYR